MVDRYTKVVLTIIAAALVAIVVQQGMRPANAQLGSGCGEMPTTPCYVRLPGFALPLEVRPVR